MFAYLTPDNLYDRYTDAKKYTEALTDPFPEYERIARNRPHPNIDPAYPKTTDGTTASIIRKTPRRVIQQVPTGKVVSDSDDWLTHIAGFIFTNKIIPYANEDYDLIQKGWNMIEKSLTYGAQPSYAPFVNHDGYFCPDLTLPYWGDIFIQRGKKSGYASNYVFLRSWWQKEDIQALIDQESKQKKKSKGYEGTWDVTELQRILDDSTTKDEKAKTPMEREKQHDVASGIELVTAFQKGVGAKFYTFHPSTKAIVRTKVNKDPRGKIPIDWMYGDIDGSNPWGRGIVELVGPLQNLIDADMQMYQFNRALMLAPPVIKRGAFNRSKVKYVPNQIIDVGTDQTADVIPLKIDSTAISNYPALYGLQKSQLLNLTNSPDTSISAQVGNPSFSKTPQGVQAQQAVISVDDNYVEKMFEAWFEKWAETAINLYFAERTGIEELQLDKETAEKLRQMPNFDMRMLSDDNRIRINYDKDTPALKFRVNPSTSKVKDDATQVQDAMQILDIVMKYPMLNKNFGGAIDTDVLARRIVINSGIDDPEQVAPEPTPQELESKELQRKQINPFSPMFDKPKISIDYGDVEDPDARAKLLSLAGAPPSGQLLPTSPRLAESAARGMGQIVPEEAGGESANKQNPIDLGDIYKQTDDPTVRAQIEQMAGLTPNLVHVENQVHTNAAQHIADQATSLGQAADAINPPQPKPQGEGQPKKAAQPAQPPQAPETPQQEAQEPVPDNEDQELVQVLTQMGVSPDMIQRALAMLHAGHSEQEILQMLGVHNA